MELKFNSLEEVQEFVAKLKPAPVPTMPVPHLLPQDFARELAALARSDRKIAAIKLYRSMLGVSLKEAKDAIEAWWEWPISYS